MSDTIGLKIGTASTSARTIAIIRKYELPHPCVSYEYGICTVVTVAPLGPLRLSVQMRAGSRGSCRGYQPLTLYNEPNRIVCTFLRIA